MKLSKYNKHKYCPQKNLFSLICVRNLPLNYSVLQKVSDYGHTNISINKGNWSDHASNLYRKECMGIG